MLCEKLSITVNAFCVIFEDCGMKNFKNDLLSFWYIKLNILKDKMETSFTHFKPCLKKNAEHIPIHFGWG